MEPIIEINWTSLLMALEIFIVWVVIILVIAKIVIAIINKR